MAAAGDVCLRKRTGSIAGAAESANLDALRSIAVLFVVASHLLPSLVGTAPGGYHLQALGLFGVCIFFVHTSLVLMSSLARQEMQLGPRNLWRIFMVRRVARIYPLSVMVVLAVQGAASLGAFAAAPTTLRTTLANLLLVQNLLGEPSTPSPLWSLPFELQMYLLLPFLFRFVCRGRHVRGSLVFLWAFSVAVVLALWRLHANYDIVKYVPCFLPGVLAFASGADRRRLSPGWLTAYVAGAAVLFPIAVGYGVSEVLFAWPICLGLGLLLPNSAEHGSSVIRRLSSTIARYSYGIYLIHVPCIDLLVDGRAQFLPSSMVVRVALFMVATAGLSWVAYRVIERPVLDFVRRRLEPDLRSKGIAVSGSESLRDSTPATV